MGNESKGAVCLAGTEKVRPVLRKIMVPDRPGNVLLNAFLQFSGCTSYVPTVPVEHKLIHDIVVVMEGTSFLVACRKGLVPRRLFFRRVSDEKSLRIKNTFLSYLNA